MMRNGSRFTVLVALAFFAWVYSCVALASDIDIRGVNFKPARPADGDRLMAAVVEPTQDSMSLLEQDAQVLKEFPKLRVRIVGFSDDQECQGNECTKLSLRRAQYVRDWFLARGFSNRQIAGAEGRGSAEPIDNNAVELGRARNRRAEVQVITFPDGKPYPPSD